MSDSGTLLRTTLRRMVQGGIIGLAGAGLMLAWAGSSSGPGITTFLNLAIVVGFLAFTLGVLAAPVSNADRLKNVQRVLATTPRGIYKAIDQNRELMEYLQKHAPELVAAHPWVAVWIKDNDILLTELAKAADVPAARCMAGSRRWPRPWPTCSAAAVTPGRRP